MNRLTSAAILTAIFLGIAGLYASNTINGIPASDPLNVAQNGNSKAYIATATTTTVKSGAGVLHTIVLGETAAGAITIYDNTAGSGTILAVMKASIAEQTFTFDVAFSTGLTIVTAGASKLTVSYR